MSAKEKIHLNIKVSAQLNIPALIIRASIMFQTALGGTNT